MISKHLLISIFLVTSLFAGSKTKRDKGKSDSTPTSGDAKDIVREEKLGKEGEEQKDAADELGEQEETADKAEEITEGGNETPKVNRLIENADESDGEAEHLEVKSEVEDRESGKEEPQGAEEEEEAEDDQVSDHSKEVRPDQ